MRVIFTVIIYYSDLHFVILKFFCPIFHTMSGPPVLLGTGRQTGTAM